MREISIIVVSYNTRALVEQCAESVAACLGGKLDYELIVVDNASTDGTPAWLRAYAETHPRLIAHCSGANLGFSGGNNAGLKLASGRYILYLNSDAYLLDDSVKAMIAHLDAHPDVGLGACLLLDGQGNSGPSYGHFPTAGVLAREIFTRRYTRLRAVCPPLDEGTHAVDFPCGAFFLIKGDLARKLGGMDESYFLYFEETDLAKRARDLGFLCHYIGGAKAVHLGGQSTQEVKSLRLVRMFYSNWRKYLLKHHGPISASLSRAMLGFYFRMEVAKSTLRGNVKMAAYFKSHRQAMVEGWRG
jgi:GT2 family glycosyltransferase